MSGFHCSACLAQQLFGTVAFPADPSWQSPGTFRTLSVILQQNCDTDMHWRTDLHHIKPCSLELFLTHKDAQAAHGGPNIPS